jgi:hypothetical protein
MDSSQIERLQQIIVGDLRPVRPLSPSWVFLMAFAIVFITVCYVGVSYLGPNGWFVLMPGQKIAVLFFAGGKRGIVGFFSGTSNGTRP